MLFLEKVSKSDLDVSVTDSFCTSESMLGCLQHFDVACCKRWAELAAADWMDCNVEEMKFVHAMMDTSLQHTEVAVNLFKSVGTIAGERKCDVTREMSRSCDQWVTGMRFRAMVTDCIHKLYLSKRMCPEDVPDDHSAILKISSHIVQGITAADKAKKFSEDHRIHLWPGTSSDKLLHDLSASQFATRISEAIAWADEKHTAYYQSVIRVFLASALASRDPATKASFVASTDDSDVPFMLSPETHEAALKHLASSSENQLVHIASSFAARMSHPKDRIAIQAIWKLSEARVAGARHDLLAKPSLPRASERSASDPGSLVLAQIGPLQLKRLEKLKDWKEKETDLANFMNQHRDFQFDEWGSRAG